MPSKRRTTRLTEAAIRYFYPQTLNDLEHCSERFRGLLPERSVMLDVGAGAGVKEELDWRGSGRLVVGVDLDPRVASNPRLDLGVLGNAESLPFQEESFNTVVSVSVMEHVENPDRVLREVYRVLKPGGLFIVKTPNREHYFARIARLTPLGFHKWYNKHRGREAEDTFPTHYRFNQVSDIERISKGAGFELLDLDGFEGVPEYLLLSIFLFLPGLVYERWTNRKPERKRWRASLEVVLKKPLTARDHEKK